MAKVKFQRTEAPTGLVQFTRNPSYGGRDPFSFMQPGELTGGGDPVVYDQGVILDDLELGFANISESDYQSLRYFLRSVIEAAKYSFDLLDHNGDHWTVLLWPPSQPIDFPTKAHRRRQGSLSFKVLSDRREFFQFDNNEDLIPRELTVGVTDEFFDEDSNEDFMPKDSITGSSEFWELDSNGDIQPI